MSYADTDEVDGVGFTVLFGKYRKEEKMRNPTTGEPLNGNVIVHAGVFRLRFDLLSTTEKEKMLAQKYMIKFVELMGRIETENRYNNLNISYHASYLLNAEIEKYSVVDTKFILLAFVIFAATLSLSMWLNLGSFKLSEFSVKSIFTNGAGYLPIFILFQFILTITSTFGTTSLLNIATNQLNLTIIFIFLSKYKRFI